MALTPVNINDNSMTPGIAAEVFLPDQLIAGVLQPVTTPVTVLQGAGVLARGTVMGQITATGKYITSLSAAGDGSQNPVGILVDTTDPTAGDALSSVYQMGEFNSHALTLGAGWTLATVTTALAARSIFVKTVNAALQNIDPT